LSGRSQQVVLNGKESNPCTVLCGVPQGSVLGPLLFLCYINDLPKWVKSSVRLYADDALLCREIHSPTDQDILQQDLYMGIYLANDIQSREECVLEDHKQLSPFIYYSMNNIPIQQVDHAKYLGVLID